MLVQIKKRLERERKSEYATHSDFCAIFIQHLERLYLLALLLTEDHPAAEQCFVAAFELCAAGSRVFKDLALSWSRRTVIKSALRIASPTSSLESRPPLAGNHSELSIDLGALLKGVQELPPFDRFVFVMAVLERYSHNECSVLLGCAANEILPARIRAMQQLSMRDQKDCPGHPTREHTHKVDGDWLECG